jgi:hypothetical protein
MLHFCFLSLLLATTLSAASSSTYDVLDGSRTAVG